MTKSPRDPRNTVHPEPLTSRSRRGRRLRNSLIVLSWTAGVIVLGLAAAGWLWFKASVINDELSAATQLVEPLKKQIADQDADGASATVDDVRGHTAAAEEATKDPLWALASALPVLGANLSAVSEVARSADDVADLGLQPLIKVFGSMNWDRLLPNSNGTDLEPLRAASPSISSAAQAVRVSAERLDKIETDPLLPQVAEPLTAAKDQLQGVTGALDAAANASRIIPVMLGAETPKNYLLMIQNNAEARATGGIPGALAVLTVDNGKLTLGAQSSAGEVGVMAPPLPVDAEQQTIYSGRLGKFMQDVNLSPDFPSAAKTAEQMWERKTGQQVDGVLAIDPVALSYILKATGPVQLTGADAVASARIGLPTELNGGNVVRTLLSDVYEKIEEPRNQDAYFAGVAQEIFSALSDGRGEAKGLVEGLTRATAEGRLLVWSRSANEQSVIAKYPLGGAISGPSVSPAQFGVYFNDGTGAKMDFYVKRSVQLIKECPRDGYEETTVRITSTNTAPADAATSLPAYVTGDGNFGVPPGTVQTNLVVYGPAQSNIETAASDGSRAEFAPYAHSNRPVGVLTVRLAPGESRTTEFTFGKIVQHTEPNLVVTPTVQDVKDVILPTEIARCT
jgi:hypothetical protein